MLKEKKLVVISHAPSENTRRMLDAVIKGATNNEITDVDVRSISPLDTNPEDIVTSHAVIIGTTETSDIWRV